MEARKEMIMRRLQEHYDYLISHGYNVIGLFLQGSQNYELDIYSEEYYSDIDSKAIILPSLEDIVSSIKPLSTTIVLENNEHIDVKDIRIWKEMFLKENISYIEILYTDFFIVTPGFEDVISTMMQKRDTIVFHDIGRFVKTIWGMALEKKKALRHPYPTIVDKIEKYGYDPKQLHHIIRLDWFLLDFRTFKSVKASFVPEEKIKRQLLDVKKGIVKDEHVDMIAELHLQSIKRNVDEMVQESIVDLKKVEWLDKLVYDVILKDIKEKLLNE